MAVITEMDSGKKRTLPGEREGSAINSQVVLSIANRVERKTRNEKYPYYDDVIWDVMDTEYGRN